MGHAAGQPAHGLHLHRLLELRLERGAFLLGPLAGRDIADVEDDAADDGIVHPVDAHNFEVHPVAELVAATVLDPVGDAGGGEGAGEGTGGGGGVRGVDQREAVAAEQLLRVVAQDGLERAADGEVGAAGVDHGDDVVGVLDEALEAMLALAGGRLRVFALGDLLEGAVEVEQPAGGIPCGLDDGEEVADRAVGGIAAVLATAGGLRLGSLPGGLGQAGPVVGVEQLEDRFGGGRAELRIAAGEAVHLLRPDDGARDRIELPAADAGLGLGGFQPLFALPQGLSACRRWVMSCSSQIDPSSRCRGLRARPEMLHQKVVPSRRRWSASVE